MAPSRWFWAAQARGPAAPAPSSPAENTGPPAAGSHDLAGATPSAARRQVVNILVAPMSTRCLVAASSLSMKNLLARVLQRQRKPQKPHRRHWGSVCCCSTRGHRRWAARGPGRTRHPTPRAPTTHPPKTQAGPERTLPRESCRVAKLSSVPSGAVGGLLGGASGAGLHLSCCWPSEPARPGPSSLARAQPYAPDEEPGEKS